MKNVTELDYSNYTLINTNLLYHHQQNKPTKSHAKRENKSEQMWSSLLKAKFHASVQGKGGDI